MISLSRNSAARELFALLAVVSAGTPRRVDTSVTISGTTAEASQDFTGSLAALPTMP